MISVDACEPELPPLEMISGQEQRQHDRFRDFVFIESHRRGREHLAEQQNDQPRRALPDHPA